MEFLYGTAFLSQSPEAYERLITDAMRGDATLFTRNDEVEAQWRICDPIVKAWARAARPARRRVRGRLAGTEGGRRSASRRRSLARHLMSRIDAVWSEQGTTPDKIEAALRKLLIEVHAEHADFAPARVLNMIAFVDREWSGEIANRLRGVGRYHASRMVVLSYEPNRERLDARVMIAAEDDPAPGELALLRETVVVELGDRHMDDLLTIADPLVVTDLPTLLWSPHGHHEIVSDLMPLAQAVLLDSVVEPDAREAVERAWELTDEAYVVDLAWLRSTPWRERIAALFDPALAASRADAALRPSRSATMRPRRPPPHCSSAGWPRGCNWETRAARRKRDRAEGHRHRGRREGLTATSKRRPSCRSRGSPG